MRLDCLPVGVMEPQVCDGKRGPRAACRRGHEGGDPAVGASGCDEDTPTALGGGRPGGGRPGRRTGGFGGCSQAGGDRRSRGGPLRPSLARPLLPRAGGAPVLTGASSELSWRHRAAGSLLLQSAVAQLFLGTISSPSLLCLPHFRLGSLPRPVRSLRSATAAPK